MKGVTKLARGPGHVALVERPKPSPGQVVVEVVGAGICGTDLHIEDGEYPSVPPVTMGHEVSGVVARLGEGVDADWESARVVSETYFSTCGACAWCRAGRTNLCPGGGRSDRTSTAGSRRSFSSRPVTSTGFRTGSTGTQPRSPSRLRVSATLSSTRTSSPKGDDVLVVGPGPVGLLAAQVAHALGGRVHVRGIPRDEARLATARELGFETSVVGRDRPGADVVVECSGHEAGMSFGLESLRRGGRLVQIGLAGKPVTVPFDQVCFKELTVTAGNASTPRSWERALALVAERAVALEPLVSEVVPLAEWERAFRSTRAGEGVKFVLDPL